MKKRIKWKTIIVLILVLALIGGGTTFGIMYYNDNIKVEDATVKKPVKVNAVEEPKIEEYSFSFVGVGDALLHNGVYYDAATGQIGSDGYQLYNFKKMLTYIKPIVKNYDLAFYNQETIIGGKHIGLTSYPCFNSPDEIGLDMIDAGFNIVNLASNHTIDRGSGGAEYSRKFWNNQKNVLAIGSYDSFKDRDTPEIKEINGITYAMLAYTYGTNGIPVPSGKEYLVNVWPMDYNADYGVGYEAYKAQVKKDIEAIRGKVDVLMVSMHWGVEYTHTPTSYQKDAAKYLASLGVDVIIGHHPHVIQPIEFIDDTLVIYSLGNFISAQEGTMKRVGMIAGFTVNKTVNEGEVTIDITDVKADLIWTHHNWYHNFEVIPFNKLNDSILPGYQGIYNEYKPIITQYSKDVTVGI